MSNEQKPNPGEKRETIKEGKTKPPKTQKPPPKGNKGGGKK